VAIEKATVLGIDAGGTSTRARVVAGEIVLHACTGGPGNPLTVHAETLAQHYAQALDGCPVPAVVAACAAGAGDPQARRQIESLLAARFPLSEIHVFPDYAGAWMAAPSGTDVVVLAGTGSVVCSRTRDGGFVSSGGLGWILGDHGSAARLGRALLEHYCAAPDAQLASRVERLFGTSAPTRIAAAIQSSPTPPALLATAAPTLTAAADRGERWAEDVLQSEMGALAWTLLSHAAAHLSPTGPLTVALAGGVWESAAAQAIFASALIDSGLDCSVARVQREPVEGAVRLAVELSDGTSARH
jgi:N-acetylmuramic acid 6-phosphate etherase